MPPEEQMKITESHMKYNPAFLSNEALIEGFCVHHGELATLVDIVRKNTLSANQHVMTIGQRGSGKTTLMHRLSAEIAQDPDLQARWFPIICSEELYEVVTLEDFWLEILFHASKQGSASAESLHTTYEELKRNHKNDPKLAALTLTALLDFSNTIGRRLLVICENMNQLFSGPLGDKEAWGLRRIMQNEPRLMFAATATKSFDQLEGKDKAFFEVFRLIELKRLSAEECRILWRSVAGREIPASQARALQILTGGLPRLMVLLAHFGRDLSFLNLMENLERLIDDHTDYFKSGIETLPVKERKVFVTLATLWQNSTAAQIAESGRMDIRETSALLNRLVGRGIVQEFETPSTGLKRRPKTYQLTERLFNIYYLMRRGDYSHFVKDFIRFIAQVFEEDFLTAVEGFRDLQRGDLPLKQQMHYDTCMSVIGEFDTSRRELGTEANIVRMGNQGIRLYQSGNWFEAAGSFREALKIAVKELGGEHPSTLVNMNNLAVTLDNLGCFSEAETLHRRTFEIRQKLLGERHRDTLESQSNLAASMNRLGLLHEAKTLHERTLEARKQVLGMEHPDTLASMNNLAATMDRLGHFKEAEQLHRQTLETRKRTLGAEHLDTLASMNNLANVLDDLGLLAEAQELHRETLTIRVRLLGALHPATLISRNNLANTLGRMNQLYEAEVLHRRTLKSRNQVLGEDHPDTLVSMNNLAVTLGNLRRMEEAELLHRQALDRRKQVLGAIHPDTLLSMNDLASILMDTGRPVTEERGNEALELFRRILEIPCAQFFIRVLTASFVSFCALSDECAEKCLKLLEESSGAGLFASLIAGIKKQQKHSFQASEEMREVADDIALWIEREREQRHAADGLAS